MSFNNSAGVYSRIQDKSFVVSGSGILSGGIVISSKRGPTDVNVVTNTRQFIETYGQPNRDNPSMYTAYRFLQRAGFLSVVRVINDAVAATVDGQDAGASATEVTITAANEGAWGNNITVSFEQLSDAPTGVFAFVVTENGSEVERYNVSRDIDAVNGFGQSIYVEDVVNNQSNYVEVQDFPDVGGAEYNDTSLDLVGGSDDTTAPAEGDISTAWDKFVNVESVDAKLLINGGWATAAVQNKMLSVAETRKDAFAILDVPQASNSDATAMVEWRDTDLGADSYHGGLYGGWLRILDERRNVQIEIPPSGDIAANFVRGVEQANIWDAVMGVDLGDIPNVLGTTINLTEGERDQLYVAGVNPVTKIGVNNAVIWGQKTLQSFASGLDRANVVMNVKDIDIKTSRALIPFVGKTNTQLNRDQANRLLTDFLETRKRNGGLYDYAVDTSTDINTPVVIDNNQFLVDIYVQPVKAMEFIRNTIVVTATGVSLSQ